MELIDIVPEFNLYEEFWKIYTKNDIIPPQYISPDARLYRCLIGNGTEVSGEVTNSVIGNGVMIGRGAKIRDSIVMHGAVIEDGAVLDKAIVAENAHIGQGAVIGCGDAVPNRVKPKIYGYGLAVVGEDTEVPPNVRIGRNTAVTGRTVPEDYPDGQLASGGILDKAGVVS